MVEKKRASKLLTSALTFLVAVVVIVLIAIALGAVGLPLWPFILFLFFYTSIDNFDSSKLPGTALGGIVGISVGMSQGVATELSGSGTVGMLVFGLLALILGTAYIMGDVAWAKLFGVLIMTLLTMFSLEPCVWVGLPQRTDMGWVEAFLRVLGSHLTAAALFAIIALVQKMAPSRK